MAGAVGLQLKQLSQGRDPLPIDHECVARVFGVVRSPFLQVIDHLPELIGRESPRAPP